VTHQIPELSTSTLGQARHPLGWRANRLTKHRADPGLSRRQFELVGCRSRGYDSEGKRSPGREPCAASTSTSLVTAAGGRFIFPNLAGWRKLAIPARLSLWHASTSRSVRERPSTKWPSDGVAAHFNPGNIGCGRSRPEFSLVRVRGDQQRCADHSDGGLIVKKRPAAPRSSFSNPTVIDEIASPRGNSGSRNLKLLCC
jgi:hypothetical protein